MKKLLICLVATFVFFGFALTSFAEGNEATAGVYPGETEESAVGLVDNSTGENVFEMMFDTFSEHISELFAGLSALFSLSVALFVKKGLIPLLSGGLSSIKAVTNKLKEDSAGSCSTVESAVEGVDSAVRKMEEALSGVSKSLEAFDKTNESVLEIAKGEGLIKTVLLSEIDLLGDIFMSSSLPEYKKQIVSEKILAMKASLAEEKDA